MGAGILAYRNQIRAQESETLVREQAALTEYRNATDEQQRNHAQSALAHLAKGVRLDPANVTIRTAIPQLLYGSAWDPLRIAPLRHPAPVRMAEFSPDGKWVLTVSDDHAARIWDAHTGRAVGMPMQHADRILTAQFNPDGTRVLTTSSDFTAAVWDASDGKTLAVYETPRQEDPRDSIIGAQYGSAGPLVVIAHASVDGNYRANGYSAEVADVGSGLGLGKAAELRAAPRSAELSPDGSQVLAICRDFAARAWNVRSGLLTGKALQHEGDVSSAHFSPDAGQIVTASEDGSARVWNAVTGEPVGASLPHEAEVLSAEFSPDASHIVTTSWDHTARLWDARTMRPLGGAFRHDAAVTGAHFSADGNRLITYSNDHSARIRDVATGKPVGEPLELWGPVTSALFSADGSRALTASADRTARVWYARASVGQKTRTLVRHPKGVNSVDISPDGRLLATASDDETARIWNAATGQPICKPLRHVGIVYSAAFSPDGTRVVTASSDFSIRIWDARTGAQIGEIVDAQSLYSAQFSPNGTQIVTASGDGTARLRNVQTGQTVGKPFQHGDRKQLYVVRSAQFSTDGARVVTASDDQTARVWDASGQPVGEPLQHQGRVWGARISRDGNRIVTASQDKTARIWNAHTGRPLGASLRHDAAVLSADFSPDGTLVVTASNDTTARLWNASNGLPVGGPLHHGAIVMSARFSPDGSILVTASADGAVRVWPIALIDPAQAAPLAAIAEVVSGATVNDQDTVVPLPGRDEVVARLRQQIQQRPGGRVRGLEDLEDYLLAVGAGEQPRAADMGKANEPPDVTVVDFDALNTVDTRHGRLNARSYLQRYGITLRDVTPGTGVVVFNYIESYGGAAIRPYSGSNALTQANSNDPVTFTMVFERSLESLSFTRPGLLAVTRSGVTFPEWTAHALDGNGREIPQPATPQARPCRGKGWPDAVPPQAAGEPLFGCWQNVAPKTFTLRGPRIRAVRFDANNHQFAAFSAIVLDDLTLRYGKSRP